MNYYDLNKQLKMNALAIKKRSRKKLILLKLSPLFGLLGMLFMMMWSFYDWNDGDIPPVVNAFWKLHSSDNKMVQISESPIRYLTFKKYVIENEEIIETMEHHDWNYLGKNKFEKNKQTVIIEIENIDRMFATMRFYNVDKNESDK